jgi:CheY-like chemotaxis protein
MVNTLVQYYRTARAANSHMTDSSSVSGSVLVVDDNEVVLAATRLFLEGAGFRVAVEQSAFQMSAAILNHRPDVILLDVRMPALNGDQAVTILKRYPFTRDIPVLLFSDLEEDELAQMVQATGAAGYVKKSAGSRRLIEEVRHWTTVSRQHRYGNRATSVH